MTYVTRFIVPPQIHEHIIGEAMQITMQLPEYNGKIIKVGKKVPLSDITNDKFDHMNRIKDQLDEALWNKFKKLMKNERK